MRTRLTILWEQTSNSFWFIPALMVIAAIILGLIMTSLDQSRLIQEALTQEPWFYAGTPDGVRALLSTIAGSMISVAGVTFSITIATLSLASSQLGPRLLTNFMRDRGNQVVLGTFVAIFVYCLIVFRTIRSADESLFVPHLSVILAMTLAVVSLAVLIYFFDHVSSMIQAPYVVANIGRELDAGIDRLISENSNDPIYEYTLRSEDDIPTDYEDSRAYVNASTSGYLQGVNYSALQNIATENDVILRVFYRPGDFIAKENKMISVYPAKALDDDIRGSLDATTAIGTKRLRVQDVEFAIEQLVEIALRALSPGINDPFTAIACIDQLSVALSKLAESAIPSGYYYDEDGHLRVMSDTVTFEGLVDTAFNQIRQYGRSDVAVTIRLLEVLTIILARAINQQQKDALKRQADMIKRAGDEFIFDKNDREDVNRRYDLLMRIYNDEQEVVEELDDEEKNA